MNETAENAASVQERLLRLALALALVLSGMLATLSASTTKAFAAEATLVDSGERFDFYQTDSNIGSHWSDSRFIIDGEDAYCIDVTTTAVAGSSYSPRSMDAGMALRIELYKQYLDEEHSGWSYLKRGGYLHYMI